MADRQPKENGKNISRPKKQKFTIVTSTSGTEIYAFHKIPPYVSNWNIANLNMLGVFYSIDGPVFDLDELLDKSISYHSPVPKLNEEFTFLFNFLEEFLTYDVSHCRDMQHNENIFKQDISKIYDNLDRLENLSLNEYLTQKQVPRNNVISRLFENVHVACIDFLTLLAELMEEEFKDQNGCCYERMYRTLYSHFFNSCCFKSRDGECYRKGLKLFSGQLIKSEPGLRCTLSKKLFCTTVKHSVLIVGKVKRRTIFRIDPDNFSIQKDLARYGLLGQHGGELLVELSDTCFRKEDCKLVFGAIGVGTQIIFTALEMKQDTYNKITNSSLEDGTLGENNFERSCIYYSKPYDILKSSDRNCVCRALLRLASVQNQIKTVQQ